MTLPSFRYTLRSKSTALTSLLKHRLKIVPIFISSRNPVQSSHYSTKREDHVPIWPYETSIATISLPKASIYDRLKAVKKAGFARFELMEMDLPEVLTSLPHFKKTVEDLGLKISIFQPFRDFEGDWENFGNRVLEFKKRLNVMKYLEIDTILLCSNCLPHTEFDEKRFVTQLRIASDLAAKKNIKIAYEALSWGTYYKDLDQSWDVAQKVDRDNFGICLDSFHIFINKCSIDLVKEMHGKIFFVQLSDSESTMNLSTMYQSRSYRNLPYQGSFDNLSLLQLIHQTGYEGPVSLECFSEVFRGFKDLDYTAKESHKSLIYLFTELMKTTSVQLPVKFTQPAEIVGFNILVDDPAFNGMIDYTDPLSPFPVVELVIDDKSVFESRQKLFGYENNLAFHRVMDASNTGHIGSLRQSLVINCSRLTYNSLVLYFKSVLQLPENMASREYTQYGLSRSRTFGTTARITVVSQQDEQPVLRNSL